MSLKSMIQSRNAVILFAVLAFGAVLYWRYPRSFRLLGQKFGRLSAAILQTDLPQTGDSPQTTPIAKSLASPENGGAQQNLSSQQQREAAFRQRQKDTKLEQQRRADMLKNR